MRPAGTRWRAQVGGRGESCSGCPGSRWAARPGDQTSAPPGKLVCFNRCPENQYIRRHIELSKYGCISGCTGCIAAAGGLGPRGHSDECRRRIEEAMEADTANEGRVRVTVAHERLNPVPSTLVVRTLSTATPMDAEVPGGHRSRSTAAEAQRASLQRWIRRRPYRVARSGNHPQS
jgi:hypothetical protein